MDLKAHMVVHCETEEQCKEFIKEAYEQGFTWGINDVNTTHYEKYRENTVYMLSEFNHILYGSVEHLDVLSSVNSDYKHCVKFKDLEG